MNELEFLETRNIILASKSPRRRMLFESLGFPFEARSKDIDESFSDSLVAGEIPKYLANKKADAFSTEIQGNDLLITSDTVVWINDHALNKPANKSEASEMLHEISGAVHVVYTGVCLQTTSKRHSFVEGTSVHFNELSDTEIDHYLDVYKPFDKAGAYGIQEFIGLIGIKKIEGDFYNVVGFPMQRFWQELSHIID